MGENVLNVVHDFGFRLDIPAIEGSLYRNDGEVPGNDQDDDDNGFVDDYHGYNFDQESSRINNLTDSPYKDHLACWSQKGDRLAYTSYEGKNAEIFIMLPDGRYDMRLTYEPAWDGAPSFSNDGSKIAFVSRRTGKSALFVMNSDGTQPTMVTEENVFFFQPQWSADDEWLIFPTRNDRDQPWEVHRIKINGTSREKTDLPFFNGVPANHEGKFIFSERTDDGEQIFMMNADGSGKKQLTHTPGKRNSQPVWSPDGKKVYFTSNREGLNRIYALDMTTGEEKRINQ